MIPPPSGTIVDAHLHVWNPARGDYPWLGPHLAPINRVMALPEVAPELTRHGVRAVVLVQSADADFDTDLMLATAREHRQVVGVVGWVPLDQPAVAADRLARLRDDPLFVGVRSLIHERADPHWILGREADAGLALLEREGVPFDFVASGHQALATAAEVARRHPGLRLILDHLGAPPLHGDADQAGHWRGLLAELAGHPQVHAKVSGLYVHPDLDGGALRRAHECIGAAWELFGSHRLMYGGDWPICLLREPYGRMLDMIGQALPDLDDRSRDGILAATAARVYRIDEQRLAHAIA